jgi:hypothetical protein
MEPHRTHRVPHLQLPRVQSRMSAPSSSATALAASPYIPSLLRDGNNSMCINLLGLQAQSVVTNFFSPQR